jgi:oligoendopeptidase F
MNKTLSRGSILVLFAIILSCFVCAAPPQEKGSEGFVPDANMDRAQVPDLYKWNLGKLFKDEGSFEKAIATVETGRERLKGYTGRLADPLALHACLDTYFALHALANRVTLYANLQHDADLVSAENQARLDRSLQVMDGLMNAARFIRGEVMGLDAAALAAACEAVPALKTYRPYIENFRRRRGELLTAEGERILSLAGDNLFAEIDLNEIPAAVEKAFAGLMADMPFPEIVDEDGKKVRLSRANYGRYRGSADRAVRKRAVDAFFATLKQYQHALAATLAGQVSFNSFLARARGFDTARQAYLGKDNIDTAVYDNLVATINDNLEPLHKYMALRKKVMGVDELRLYDLYVPMVAGVEKEIPFDEASALIIDALAPLGAEYIRRLEHGLDPANGWIDLYPCRNKDSGAFSASTFGFEPYVKMNYFNTLDDASTLAHEFGHALHTWFSMQNQPSSSSRYVSFIAEIASTFNETLLAKNLIANAASKEEKLHLLTQQAESIRTTIYRQTLFAEFEKTTHELYESGAALTSDLLNETYIGLVKRYYGEAYTIGPDDDIEWAYIPHFYWKFYVFTYATGLSAGISLANGVVEGGDPARDRYLEMLRGGCSKPPLELLRAAGVDLTKPDAIKDAADLLDRTLDEMEALLR